MTSPDNHMGFFYKVYLFLYSLYIYFYIDYIFVFEKHRYYFLKKNNNCRYIIYFKFCLVPTGNPSLKS